MTGTELPRVTVHRECHDATGVFQMRDWELQRNGSLLKSALMSSFNFARRSLGEVEGREMTGRRDWEGINRDN